MNRISLIPSVLIVTCLALADCDGGARDIDYTNSRGINSDIAAVHEHGPTSLYPGDNFGNGREPIGVFPWQINEYH